MAAAAAPAPPAEETEALADHLMQLSNLGRTVGGTGFAYLSVSCVGKRIGLIKAIETYVQIQTIDLSNNMIKDVQPLRNLQFVLKLNLSNNSITTLKSWDSEEGYFPHLVDLDVSGNQLSSLPSLQLKALRTASLARNEIVSTQEFKGHERLEVLDLSDNKLASFSGIANLPVLTKLDVSNNLLTSINGLSGVPLLEVLNLESNKFETLAGPWQELGALKSLNLSGNQLAESKTLEVLRSSAKLRELQVKGNPFLDESESEWRVQVLRRHWRLEVLDGSAVTAEELEQTRSLNVLWLEEERAKSKTAQETAPEE